VDLRAPNRTSAALERVMGIVRSAVPHYELDRYFAPDIAAIAKLVRDGAIAAASPLAFASEAPAA
jgi:histidine ammonia-lyase